MTLEGPPETHTPHPHHRSGLPRWLELVIAVTALVTSISSIAIALHHGEIMEKLVEANSIPYMQGGFSEATPEGVEVLSLDLLNRGVGPAHQKSLFVKVGDRYVRSLPEFITASLGPVDAHRIIEDLNVTFNNVPTRFIPGGEQQLVFRTAKTAENAALWERLAESRGRWQIEFCYCSVFDECWRVRSKWEEPEHADECVRDPAREFLPGGQP